MNRWQTLVIIALLLTSSEALIAHAVNYPITENPAFTYNSGGLEWRPQGFKITTNTTYLVILNISREGSSGETNCLLVNSSGTILKNATFDASSNCQVNYTLPYVGVYYIVGTKNGANVTQRTATIGYPVLGTVMNWTQGGYCPDQACSSFGTDGTGREIASITFGTAVQLTVQAINSVNGSIVTGLCMKASGTSTIPYQCNSTGTILGFNTTGTYNITVYSIGVGDNSTQTYYNQTIANYNFNAGSTLIVNTSQALLNVTAYTAYYNTSIASFTVTNNLLSNSTSTNATIIPANNGTNNIRVDVAGNTSLNFTAIVQQILSTQLFAATGIYDNVINSSGTGAPVISGLNCTSCNPPFGSTSSPYLTSDTTPTFKFGTNINANCRVGVQDQNYTTMGASRQCMAGEGLVKHTCTLTSQDALPAESGTMYIACANTNDSNQSATSTSGSLVITGVATTPQAAIDYGIHHSIVWPGATVYQNQQVYMRDLTHTPVLATTDRVVVYGNQRWIFNANNFTILGLFNISPVVYSLEMSNMTFLQIEGNVTAFINSTKS